jgi:hypothetical protein
MASSFHYTLLINQLIIMYSYISRNRFVYFKLIINVFVEMLMDRLVAHKGRSVGLAVGFCVLVNFPKHLAKHRNIFVLPDNYKSC